MLPHDKRALVVLAVACRMLLQLEEWKQDSILLPMAAQSHKRLFVNEVIVQFFLQMDVKISLEHNT